MRATQVVKHLEPELVDAAGQGNLEPFLASRRLTDFSICQHMAYMAGLADTCRPAGVLAYLLRSCGGSAV